MTMAQGRLRYGVDAPGVVAGLLGAGVGGLALGWVVPWVGPLVMGVAVVPLVLGVSMVVYAFVGKYRLRDAMLGMHTWRGDEVVLDVGAGRGLMAVGAALRVPRGRVVAVDVWRDGDLSGNGPEALRVNAVAEGVAERVEIVTGDASALALADGSVDVVLSVLCLHNIEPEAARLAALSEIARVLKPGGCAIVADYIKTGEYAQVFGAAGMVVRGPLRMEAVALSLSAVVVAEKV